MLGSLQQIDQLIFPQRRHRMTPMPARFLAQREHNRASIRHAIWVIVSLEDQDTPDVKGYWLKDLKIADAELVVE